MHPPRKTYGGRKICLKYPEHAEVPSPPSEAVSESKISLHEMAHRMKKRTRHLASLSARQINSSQREENTTTPGGGERDTKKRRVEPVKSQTPDDDASMNVLPTRSLVSPTQQSLASMSTKTPPFTPRTATYSRTASHRRARRIRPTSSKRRENHAPSFASVHASSERSLGTQSRIKLQQMPSLVSPSANRALKTSFNELATRSTPLAVKTPNFNIPVQTFLAHPTLSGNASRISIARSALPVVRHLDDCPATSRPAASAEGKAGQSLQPLPHTGRVSFEHPSTVTRGSLVLEPSIIPERDVLPLRVGGFSFAPLVASTPKPRAQRKIEVVMNAGYCINFSGFTTPEQKARRSTPNYHGRCGASADARKSPDQQTSEDRKMEIDDSNSATPRTSTLFETLQYRSGHEDQSSSVQSSVSGASHCSRTSTPTPRARTRKLRQRHGLFSSKAWSMSVPAPYASLSNGIKPDLLHTKAALRPNPRKRTRPKASIAHVSLPSRSRSSSPPPSTAHPRTLSLSQRSSTDMSLTSVAGESPVDVGNDTLSDMSLGSPALPTSAFSDSLQLESRPVVSSGSSYSRQGQLLRQARSSLATAVVQDGALRDNLYDACYSNLDFTFDPSSAFTRGALSTTSSIQAAERPGLLSAGIRTGSTTRSALNNRSSIWVSSRANVPTGGAPSKRVSFAADVRSESGPNKSGLSTSTCSVVSSHSSLLSRARISSPSSHFDGARRPLVDTGPSLFPAGVYASTPLRTASPATSSPDPLDIISPTLFSRRDMVVPSPRLHPIPVGWSRMPNRLDSPSASLPGSSPDPLLLIPRPRIKFIGDEELDKEV